MPDKALPPMDLLDPDRKTRYDASLASGRPSAPESGPMVQDDTLELTEQPADDPPFSAKILDAGKPTSEELDARIEALAGLHRSLSGDEPLETSEQPEPAKIDETESTDASADLAGDESQPEVESGVASRPSMPGPTRIEEVRGAVVPGDGTGQGETGAAFDRLTIWTTALTFLAALCVVGIAAWVLQSQETSTLDSVATNSPVPSGTSADQKDSASAVPAEEVFEPIEPADLNPGEDAKSSPPTPDPPTADLGDSLEPTGSDPAAETERVAAEPLEWPWQGNWSAQVEEWTNKLHRTPEDTYALVQRGVALCKNRDLDGAMADLDRAIEISPALARAYYNRGVAWIVAGDYDAAISDLDKAIELEPLYGMAYTHRGLAYERKGLTALAQTDYVKGSKLWDRQPDYAKASKMWDHRSEERRVGKECRSRWSPYH